MKQDRKKRSRVSKLTDTNTPFARLLLVPSLAGVLVFFIIPFMIVIWYSFLDNPINKDFVFLRNYQVLFKNNAFITAAKNTLILSAVAVPLAVVAGSGKPAGFQDTGKKYVPNIFPLPHDGSRGFRRADMAGSV